MKKILHLLGVTEQQSSHAEKLISLLGGVISIYAIFLVTNQFLGVAEAVYIIPSMGASAVLLFAAPNVPFSQPWNVFGGHIISAIIGVACYQLIPDIHFAAAASVGFAIGAMYYTKCIHPPGGASALAAVIGSSAIHDLGYMYVITPVLINTVTILIIAVLFNALFSWRHYPAVLKKASEVTTTNESVYPPIKHEDFVYALSQIDSIVDINENDLQEIYAIATGRIDIIKNK
ncbi:MAG TPA: HPP family protein [Leucothrix sp.]|nr:HPP family protein [Leucothrix sp.]